MQYKAYTYHLNDLTLVVNQSREIYLTHMVDEGIITEEQAAKMKQYCVVISEKGMLGRFFDRLWGKDNSNDLNVLVVKVMNPVPAAE